VNIKKLSQLGQCPFALMAVKATLALKAGVWFRRVRFVMISPDSRQPRCRCQAENPLIVLSRFPEQLS